MRGPGTGIEGGGGAAARAAGALGYAAPAGGGGDDDGGGATGAATTSTASTGSGGGSTGSMSTGAGGATTGAGGGSTGSTSTATGTTGSGMGTPCTGSVCDLHFAGTGFAEHDGQTLHAGLVEQGVMGLAWEGSAVVQNGSFTIDGPGALKKGVGYLLNYYADVNGNQACEPTPTDHVWRTSLSPVSDHVFLVATHDAPMSNLGCSGFP